MNELLIIGYVWPEPKSSAAGSRMMQLVSIFLEKSWKITFVSPATPNNFTEKLEKLGVHTQKIKPNDSAFDKFLVQLAPEVVLFDRFMMEEQFGWRVAQHCPKSIRMLNTEDLHFLRKARQKAIKNTESSMPDLHTDDARREIAAILRCDVTLLISEAEKELLVREFRINQALLHYLPFLLPSLNQKEVQGFCSFEARKHLTFIGNFLHPPNWDSVLYLKEKIWSKIRKQLPEVQLHIYGAYTSNKVKQLHQEQQGFLIMGRAENSSETLKKYRLLLAPLRFGAGIKGKFIEAMQCGTPSITTTVGAEGICSTPLWSGSIADTEAAIITETLNLYQDKKQWEKAQQRGIEIINTRFQKSQFYNVFFERLNFLSEHITGHRRKNFTGSMLMYHTMQSTKYMARWIEAKNKTN